MEITLNQLESNLRNFNANNPQNYRNTFDYKQNGSNYDQLNFVYLIDKKLFRKLLMKFGIQKHQFHQDNQDENFSAVDSYDFSNRQLIDEQMVEQLDYISLNQNFKQLSNILKDYEEDDIQFVNETVAEFFRQNIEEFTIIKKVVYINNNQIKFELYNPIVNVLILSNDDTQKKNIHKKLQNQIHKISISRFVSKIDLANIFIEICQQKLQIQNQQIREYKILLPEQNEINSKHFKSIIKCQANVQEMKLNNISEYEIYQDRLIIFYFKDAYSDFHLKFRQKRNSANKPEQLQYKCHFCGQSIDHLGATYCICKNRYCDSKCRQRDQSHSCKGINCVGCQMKMISSDLDSLVYCQCGELLCQNRCFKSHQKRQGCQRILQKTLKSLNQGQIGLSNIGNTCYMNSALQCLLNNDSLKQYFCLNDHSKEINKDNPLGTKGQLLGEFTNLFRTYYSTSRQYISPTDLKYCIAQHLSTFEGYGQHDAQELLSQLMDSLHEDLNRILHKPYTEPVEGILGDNIEQLARKSWINYLKRNYSFFTENFYGQFKSILVCPLCENNSVTFDPFQLISLSIPTLQTERLDYFYIDEDQNTKAKKAQIILKSIHKFNDIKAIDLKKNISQLLNKPIDNFICAALGFTCTGEVFSDSTGVSQILFARQKNSTRPKIFICELNDYEQQCKKSNNFQYIFLRFNYECYDSKEVLGAYELYQLKKKYPDNPIFTKLSLINQNTTIQDLYGIVLRKLIKVTSLKDSFPEKKKTQNIHDFYLYIMNILVTKQKNKQFFYIKIENNDQILLPNDTTKLIDMVDTNKKIVFNVFIKNEDNTTTHIELDQFTNCSVDRDYNMEFSSNDLSEYKKHFNLYSLLDNFSMKEELDEQNSWYCNKCKKHVQASKTLQIYKLPHYLIIHLKKLKNIHTQTPMIDFPINNLDMSKYVINPQNIQQYNIQPEEFYQPNDLQYFMNQGISPQIETLIKGSSMKYDLYAVVDHSGSQHFGHYTSKCKVDNEEWRQFNDARVSNIDQSNIVSEKAYILFYRRNNQQNFLIQLYNGGKKKIK